MCDSVDLNKVIDANRGLRGYFLVYREQARGNYFLDDLSSKQYILPRLQWCGRPRQTCMTQYEYIPNVLGKYTMITVLKALDLSRIHVLQAED